MDILHSESAYIYDKIAKNSILMVLLDFFYTQPKFLHAQRSQRSWQILGMWTHAKQCQKTLFTVRVKDIRTQLPKPQLDTISCHNGRLMCNSMLSWLQSLLYSVSTTHLCVFTKRYPLGEVWFWLKSYSTTSPRFASIPWWSSCVICVVPLFLGQTISQQHKVRWLFGCNYWREHWHWKIYCAGSKQVESESDCGGNWDFDAGERYN